MNQLLTKRTLSLGRINLFLKYKIRLKNALASNIESKFHLEVFFKPQNLKYVSSWQYAVIERALIDFEAFKIHSFHSSFVNVAIKLTLF